MKKKIKILHLEDSSNDSELIRTLIEIGKIEHYYFLADNEKDFRNILETEDIDIILSDYNLPDYNGSEALRLSKEKYSHMPFIFVSGAMGEDRAIDAMLNGATDYVLKNKLERLVPAINRAIREHELEIKRHQAEVEIKEKKEQIEAQNKKYIQINKELAFQNEEKAKRAAELLIANKELIFQNIEKEKRAAELIVANKKLKKNEEKILAFNAELEQRISERTTQVEAANKAKSEFLSNMSHEIRTPMNAVLGYADLLSFMIKDKTQKDYVESIKTSGRSLLTLINGILDLSKIEAGKLELKLEFVDSQSFFSDFERIFSLKLLEKGLRFILEISSDTPAGIYIDDARLRQIILNLIGNAIKFTDNGSIKLKVYIENSKIISYSKEKVEETIDLIIEVTDTGIGITKEMQGEIFNPFVQGQNQDTKKYGGTGLGLAISKRLVELMNGTIELNSQLSKGSSFKIKIPEISYLKNFKKRIEEIHLNPAEIEFEEAVILIVDDVKLNRSYLKDALRNTNLKIFEAEDGKEALSIAKRIVPDIIIADIRMPGLDGFEMLNEIKSDETLKIIPVIAYSASVMKTQKDHIRESKFNGLLIKPVQVIELYLELMKHLAYKSTQITEQKELVQENVLVKTISDYPGLIHSLETNFMETWKTFAIRQPIDEIREFGKQLKNLGETHNATLIIDLGEELVRAADSFDIEAILIQLKKFTGIIESIKDSTKKLSDV